MTSGKDLPPGYLLKITTSENDADNYNTEEIRGIQTTDEVNFYIAVCELFFSENDNSRDHKRFGNSDALNSPVAEAIIKIVDEWHCKSLTVVEEWDYTKWDSSYHPDNGNLIEVASDYYSDLLYDIGLGAWGEGEYWRVFEKFEVFFVPSEIQNVTHQFT